MSFKLYIKETFILFFAGFTLCDTKFNEICINWEKSQGTRSFVDELFVKYGAPKIKANTGMNRLNLAKLLQNLDLGTVLVQCQNGDAACQEDISLTHTAIGKMNKDKRSRNKRAVKSRFDDADDEEYRRLVKEHDRHWKEHIDKCLKPEMLLSLHKINMTQDITERDFLRLCPSLVQQIDQKICVHKHKEIKVNHHDHDSDHAGPTQGQIWGYGMIAITIISLLSLSVIAVIPCLKKSFYTKVMSFLVALAVGTLAGDAMLHLIPHAFLDGAMSVSKIIVSEEEELKQHYSLVWRALFVLLGMYAFFVVEQLLKLHAICNKDNADNESDEQRCVETVSNMENESKIESRTSFSLREIKEVEDGRVEEDNCNQAPLSPKMSCQSNLHEEQIGHFHADDRHHHHHHGNDITKSTKIASVAWMVIVGDGFHNFSDGLAVGAAFTASISSGVSTAIAVFCHELPHELGDFAILIKSGMTIKQAVVYNVVSAVLAYIGLIIGILVGGNEMGRHFILSITAGLFLYVSLADMLPELTHQRVPHQSRCAAFICQHIGILTGIGIMLLISLYEHSM